MISELKPSTYLNLPADFYEAIDPVPVSKPRLLKFNHQLAKQLGINDLSDNQACELFSGNKIPSALTSIALAYSGHQFGYYVPLLGDGRAVILGEIEKEGKRWDVQLKGSGLTRFSRQGDGRAPLSAVIREYLMSEAMHGLGIPTTRSLAAIATEDKIYRQEGLVPAGVLTRIASSHLRIGSFQYAAALNHSGLLKDLADYTIERHYPHLKDQDNAYLGLFEEVIDRQAHLMVDWMGMGFVHGVMNTDNMTLSGETIDYGPCAFIDEFDINSVYSAIDVSGRYAFGNQALIAQWNLLQLKEALLPLFPDQALAWKQMETALETFAIKYNGYWLQKMKQKLGLVKDNEQSDLLINDFLALLQSDKPDFTMTFRMLPSTLDSQSSQEHFLNLFQDQKRIKQWLTAWQAQIKKQKTDKKEIKAQMLRVNPAYIPRNHLINKAIQECIERSDTGLMERLLSVFIDPFTEKPHTEDLQCPPQDHERVYQTFCGT